MKSMSGKELAKLVESRGWSLMRIHGSHHIYGKPGSVVRLSIPIHGQKILTAGLVKHLLKMAEIEDEEA